MEPVRRAAAADAQGIADVEQHCFHTPLEKEQIERLILAGDQTVLCIGSEPVNAYISMQTVLDEGYINNVAVLPEFRRRGLARRLLCALEEQGSEKKLAFITLEVRESNSGAISLYESCGYERVGLRKNYYEKPKENAIIMTKFLK